MHQGVEGEPYLERALDIKWEVVVNIIEAIDNVNYYQHSRFYVSFSLLFPFLMLTGPNPCISYNDLNIIIVLIAFSSDPL